MTDQTRPMDAERLAEIRQRAEAATPGLWHPQPGYVTWDAGGTHPEVCTVHGTEDTGVGQDKIANVAFIAASRQDILDLLAEVVRLRAVVEEARAKVAMTLCTSGDATICERCKILTALDRGLKGAGDE